MKQSTLIVLFIFGLVISNIQSQYNIQGLKGYRCHGTTKMSIAIRLNSNNRIECLSSNGRTCIRGLNSERSCLSAINRYERISRPLKCSGDEINRNGHWCNRAFNYYFRRWHCPKDTGIHTAFRLDEHTGNSMCISYNGKDCLWGKQAEHVCKRVQWCHKTRSRLIPVVCGPKYKKSGCSQGYNSYKEHWCKKSFAFFKYDGKWIGKSKIGVDNLIQMNVNGEIVCASKNGRKCISNIHRQRQSASSFVKGLQRTYTFKPLICGAPHKKARGNYGFDKVGHWCNSALRYYFNTFPIKGCKGYETVGDSSHTRQIKYIFPSDNEEFGRTGHIGQRYYFGHVPYIRPHRRPHRRSNRRHRRRSNRRPHRRHRRRSNRRPRRRPRRRPIGLANRGPHIRGPVLANVRPRPPRIRPGRPPRRTRPTPPKPRQVPNANGLFEVKGFIKRAGSTSIIPSSELTSRRFSATFKADNGKVYTARIIDGGKYFVELPMGRYTRTISMNGFIGMTNIFIVRGSVNEFDVRNRIFLSKILQSNDWRILVTWGFIPRDLDSHLFTPNGRVFYGRKRVGNAWLEADVTSGSGPEVIRISNAQSGNYKYVINNYSREVSTMRSQARVNVFRGAEHVAAFSVPTSGYPNHFYYWHVFDLDARTGQITVINKLKPSLRG